MCFSVDQCIASGIRIFTFANSSRNIPLNISFFIHFLYTFCVRFKAKATAGFDIRGLKCPEFLAMTTPKKVQTVVKKHPKAFRRTQLIWTSNYQMPVMTRASYIVKGAAQHSPLILLQQLSGPQLPKRIPVSVTSSD